MKDLFRRWFGAASDADVGEAIAQVQAWAEGKRWRFARRGNDGFALEAGVLRVEWGAPQRHYIAPAELRVRADLGEAVDLQLLAVSRGLMTRLEQEVFEQATEGNRTRVDDHTPEEMRWLVLYPRMPRSQMGDLAESFGVLSNHKRTAEMWIDEPFRAQLAAAAACTPQDEALIITVQRGRFVLRQAMGMPSVSGIEGTLKLAAAALASARQVSSEVARGGFDTTRVSEWATLPDMPSGDGTRT